MRVLALFLRVDRGPTRVRFDLTMCHFGRLTFHVFAQLIVATMLTSTLQAALRLLSPIHPTNFLMPQV